MPITGSGWPGGYLSTDMVLQGIGDVPGSQLDFVGFGELIGAGDGVVGSTDSVIFPTDFWGKDVNKTATSITLSPSSTNLTNASQTYTLSVVSNGVGNLNFSNNWASPSVSYFTGNTNVTIIVNSNSALGQSNRELTIQALGSGNVVRDTHTLSQTGNPASITYSPNPPEYVRHTSTGTQFTITKSSNVNFTNAVSIGNSLLTLTLISTVGNVRTYGVEWTSGPSYSESALTTSIFAEVTDGSSFYNQSTVFNVPGYLTVNHPGGTDIIDPDGETITITPTGEVGSTWSIALTYMAAGTTNVSSGTVGDSYIVTIPVNTTGSTRSFAITITDTTTNNTGNSRSYSQDSQVIAAFQARLGGTGTQPLTSPYTHTFDASTASKTFVIKCEPFSNAFSSQIKTSNYGTSDFEHVFHTQSPGTFVSSNTEINITPVAPNWEKSYTVKPITNNTSITTQKTDSVTVFSVADTSKTFTFNFIQEPLVVLTSYYLEGSSPQGLTSSNPIQGIVPMRIWSTSNLTSQQFRLTLNIGGSGSGGGWSESSAGSATFLTTYPTYNTWYSPAAWSGPTGGYYYRDVYFRPNTSSTVTTQSIAIRQPEGCTTNMSFTTTPTSSCHSNPMGQPLFCRRQF